MDSNHHILEPKSSAFTILAIRQFASLQWESNPHFQTYKDCALPLSYRGIKIYLKLDDVRKGWLQILFLLHPIQVYTW